MLWLQPVAVADLGLRRFGFLVASCEDENTVIFCFSAPVGPWLCDIDTQTHIHLVLTYLIVWN